MSYIDIENVDLSSIEKNSVFAIDTNVLYWTHYSQASNPNLHAHPYQVTKYPNFISKLLDEGYKLVTTVLNITELVNLVEHSQHKLYKASNGSIKFKDYRKLAGRRNDLKQEVELMINEIRVAYDDRIEVIDIPADKVDNFITNADTNQLDIFDYFVVEYLKSKGIIKIISDDKDFESYVGIELYSTSAN